MKEVYPWELWSKDGKQLRLWEPPASKQKRRTRRRLRYGLGMIGGVAVVEFLKRTMRSVPFIGAVVSPVLALVPTTLLGAAVGAAAVYGYEQGDPLAAVHLLPKAREELLNVAESMEKHVEEKQQRIAGSMKRLHGKAQRHLDEAVDEVASDMQRQLREASRKLDVDRIVGRLERELDDGFNQLKSPPLGSSRAGAAGSGGGRSL